MTLAYGERLLSTRVLVQVLLHHLPQLLSVIDWSPISAHMHWHLLRASVVVAGRGEKKAQTFKNNGKLGDRSHKYASA
jgi:hypothetical protein